MGVLGPAFSSTPFLSIDAVGSEICAALPLGDEGKQAKGLWGVQVRPLTRRVFHSPGGICLQAPVALLSPSYFTYIATRSLAFRLFVLVFSEIKKPWEGATFRWTSLMRKMHGLISSKGPVE